MMALVGLINRDMDKLAEVLSSEHGKTFPDAKGDIQRGLEVIEFCIGAPHLLKGEFTDSAGPGIDMYSMRQPLGVVAGITPFNFPAMIPLWKMGPALACGNAMILKPSERDPSVPIMLAELCKEAGLPDGVLQVINGDKEAVDAILDNEEIQAVGFVGSTPIAHYIYSRATANGKRAQCFGGAKNHMIIMPDADMDQAADALVGAGYGAAGERCMAISVAVPVGEETADALRERLVPKIEKLKVGPYTAGDDVDYGPVVTQGRQGEHPEMVESGVEQGAELVVDGRDFQAAGL
jgi:malonate-semialdehyde dehydrogenase (acetylating) / methylmalonate-semialdehyde dehydrogenase